MTNNKGMRSDKTPPINGWVLFFIFVVLFFTITPVGAVLVFWFSSLLMKDDTPAIQSSFKSYTESQPFVPPK